MPRGLNTPPLGAERTSQVMPHSLLRGVWFEFPHFAIHRAKRFPSQSDGNTLHIKVLWKAGFSERFLCKMSMLPKAARPFGSIVSAIIKNGETQKNIAYCNWNQHMLLCH